MPKRKEVKTEQTPDSEGVVTRASLKRGKHDRDHNSHEKTYTNTSIRADTILYTYVQHPEDKPSTMTAHIDCGCQVSGLLHEQTDNPHVSRDSPWIAELNGYYVNIPNTRMHAYCAQTKEAEVHFTRLGKWLRLEIPCTPAEYRVFSDKIRGYGRAEEEEEEE